MWVAPGAAEGVERQQFHVRVLWSRACDIFQLPLGYHTYTVTSRELPVNVVNQGLSSLVVSSECCHPGLPGALGRWLSCAAVSPFVRGC